MKTLKESILNRSSHGAKGFETQIKEMIEKWLKEYDIENYTINDDFTIDVNGNVNLFRRNLKELPDYIQFGVVRGNFVCTDNNLISLRGCPREVGKSFYCEKNKLTSLKGAPKKVGGDFDCTYNKLTSLEGSPKEVGWTFDCRYNRLTSLEGAPKEVEGYFDCSNNFILFSVDDAKKVCRVKRTIIVK